MISSLQTVYIIMLNVQSYWCMIVSNVDKKSSDTGDEIFIWLEYWRYYSSLSSLKHYISGKVIWQAQPGRWLIVLPLRLALLVHSLTTLRFKKVTTMVYSMLFRLRYEASQRARVQTGLFFTYILHICKRFKVSFFVRTLFGSHPKTIAEN